MAPNLKVLRHYLELKASLSQLEGELEELKPKVEAILDEEPEKKAHVDDAILCLSWVKKQGFDLKLARDKMEPKLLKPYLTQIEYSQIRVTYRPKEAA